MPIRPQRLSRPWVPVIKTGIVNRPRDPFYHTSAWKNASKQFLFDNPLCYECAKTGMLTPSKVTDHDIPKNVCDDPWDPLNWKPLCFKCHSKKSAKDKIHFK